VVVLGMSIDPDTALAAWAKESRYPGIFVSDSTLAVSKLYGSVRGNPPSASARNVFVIGPDGRITHRMMPFSVTADAAYKELEQAVDKAAGVSPP
jgi:peroxiredoxin